MKYCVIDLINTRSVTVTTDGIDSLSFSCIVGNQEYDNFLVDAKLTDEEVHALGPDIWYDFPTEENK